MARQEERFINDPRGTLDRSTPAAAWNILKLAIVLIGVATGWAAIAEVEQMTTGIGRFIPSRQLQLVESLDAGIVSEIVVREGDIVSQGQPLVKVDATSTNARLGELRKRRAALKAELSRLSAQTGELETFYISDDADPAAMPFLRNQQAVFAADREERAGQILVREQQIRQREQRFNETETDIKRKRESLVFAERELELSRQLNEKQAIPEIEFLRIERAVSDLRGDVSLLQATRERLAAEIEEARMLKNADRSAFLAKAFGRVAEAEAELSVVEEALGEAEFRVGRTILRSPVNGVVNKLNIRSIGEVIQGGFTVVEIVPLDDQLLIETRISPKDIAFIRPGLVAKIRLSAYDYTKYGTLTGEVVRIGADTIVNEEQEAFYQVIVRTDNREQQENSEINIIPGMIATVSISTGDRTVLEYLLKPVLRVRDFAFRET